MESLDRFGIDLRVVVPVAEFCHNVFDHFDQVVSVRPGDFRNCGTEPASSGSMRPRQRYGKPDRTLYCVLRLMLLENSFPRGGGDASGSMEVPTLLILPALLYGGFRRNELLKKLNFHFDFPFSTWLGFRLSCWWGVGWWL